MGLRGRRAVGRLAQEFAGRWEQGLTAEKMTDCPVLVGQFEFREWTPDDHLPHSRFVGLREDKHPKDVRREIGCSLLMHVRMPIMGDHKATARVREWETEPLPHWHAMTADRQKAIQSGMDGYVTKAHLRRHRFVSAAVK